MSVKYVMFFFSVRSFELIATSNIRVEMWSVLHITFMFSEWKSIPTYWFSYCLTRRCFAQ